MAGDKALLPCNSSHWKGSGAGEATPISLVLWFKEQGAMGSGKTPIYTLDVRNQVSLSRSRHIPSSGMRDRAAKFDLSLSPPRLVMRNISKSDEGLFRCRVRPLLLLLLPHALAPAVVVVTAPAATSPTPPSPSPRSPHTRTRLAISSADVSCAARD